jgi:hypothetical protein
MKTISFFRLALALCLLPATLAAQSRARDKDHNEPINYYAEFAELMHSEAAAKSALVTSPSVNSFDAFVYYRKVMKGSAEDFIADYEAMAVSTLNYFRCRICQSTGRPQGLHKLDCQKTEVAGSPVQ